MKIQLVSHASVVIKTSDTQIWTDPWLISKVFNDSWSLRPEPVFDPAIYEATSYLWISHEHPDHFNIPTLRAMPSFFKERVVVLFQEKNTEKVFEALRAFGFRNFQELPHRKTVRLTGETAIYCYQSGIMDSVLAVQNRGETIVNINDAKLNDVECRRIRKDLGKVDVVLNQFSLAGYNGELNYRDVLPGYARQDLDNLVSNHKALGASSTIPFASFVYFSSRDNHFMNEFANSPASVRLRLGSEAVILYPGETYTVGEAHDSEASLRRFETEQPEITSLPFDEPRRVEIAEIRSAFEKLASTLHDRYPAILFTFLRPVTAHIPDLNMKIRFSIAQGTLDEISADDTTDLVVNSQPLEFGFRFPWGFQTLGVSARFFIRANYSNWKRHRILFSLNNGEIFLRPRYFFRPANLLYLAKRIPGGVNQVFSRLERMI